MNNDRITFIKENKIRMQMFTKRKTSERILYTLFKHLNKHQLKLK